MTIAAERTTSSNNSLCFSLAEQKNNEAFPFAFLATYAYRIQSEHNNSVLHVPLSQALTQNKDFLLTLLAPLQNAAKRSTFLSQLIEKGDIFRANAWTASQAYLFLKDVPLFEQAGVKVRVPNWWDIKKPARPAVTVKIDKKTGSLAGLASLLDFDMDVTLPDGEVLSQEEINTVLNSQGNLVRIRGQWLEVDRAKLSQVLDYWTKKKRKGLSFLEGLRTIAGVHDQDDGDDIVEDVACWSTVIEGKFLQESLASLRNPEIMGNKTIETTLKDMLQAQLRPYQLHGVGWLWALYNLQLGGCLADDMGLGKTMQILSLLLLIQKNYPERKHLLIVPASLVGNWVAEIKRFAPGLSYFILHGSEHTIASIKAADLLTSNLVITTYGMVSRLSLLQEITWDIIIADEAQAIKNPGSKQTRAVKALQGRVNIGLTGTPIENSLLDLWSLFDFVATGLLGKSKKFTTLINRSDDDQKKSIYLAIGRLVSPYILRRLKSDKRIINDLPDKTEVLAFCTLTKHQAMLYQTSVEELAAHLEGPLDEMKRRGLVLSYLMRLKQICNHPNQWLGHAQYESEASGKFIRLRELCTEIAQKKEKVLIFTQFKEIIPSISLFLTPIFGKSGLELDGSTALKKRSQLVAAFQSDDGPPFFILSLKAGGTGLNLTKATHVIHFDRWWNPAVEDQATDRAYRIGQKKNVLVHKFMCRGTIEEKIDEIISQKRLLSDAVMKTDSEIVLSELSNAELLKVVALDLDRALGE